MTLTKNTVQYDCVCHDIITVRYLKITMKLQHTLASVVHVQRHTINLLAFQCGQCISCGYMRVHMHLLENSIKSLNVRLFLDVWPRSNDPPAPHSSRNGPRRGRRVKENVRRLKTSKPGLERLGCLLQLRDGVLRQRSALQRYRSLGV